MSLSVSLDQMSQSRTHAYSQRLADSLGEALARSLAEAARSYAPYDSLRDAIVVQSATAGWQVAVTVPWARAIEFGTRNRPAQAFLAPAVEAVCVSFGQEVKLP